MVVRSKNSGKLLNINIQYYQDHLSQRCLPRNFVGTQSVGKYSLKIKRGSVGFSQSVIFRNNLHKYLNNLNNNYSFAVVT